MNTDASSGSDSPGAVRAAPAHHKGRPPPHLTAHTYKRQEAAALLALWSALVLIEGTVRFVLSAPTQDLTPAGREPGTLPPLLLVLASLAECAFGLTGVLVGCGAAFFNAHSRPVTLAFLASQMPLSWFVFLVYVFLVPAYRGAHLGAPINPFDTVGESRAFIATGIVTSVTLCLALQGGQYAFGARLAAHQSPPGRASASAARMAAARGVFWNGNMLLGGLASAVAGLLLLANVGAAGAAGGGAGNAGRLAAPYAAPPHVGVFPVATLVTGLVMMATGLAGMAACVARRLVRPFLALTVVNYVLMYVNFALLQVGGISPMGPIQAGAMHPGLVLLTGLIGPYFAYRARLGRHEVAAAEADDGGV